MSVPKLRFKDEAGRDFPDWENRTIGNTLSIGSGRDYKHLSNGSIPVYGTGGYMLSVDDYLYDGESVCIGRKGTIDKPTLLNGKFWTVDTLFYTHSFKSCIPKFIYATFQKIDWKNYNEASGVPSLSKSTIEKIEISVPSITEQTKIAIFLSAVDEKITQLTRKCGLLAQYKKGVMQQIFSQQLRFKDDDGRDFPEWEDNLLVNYSETIQSGKSKARNAGGDFVLYGSTGAIGFTDNPEYEGKAILIARVGANAGYIYEVNGEYCVSDNTLILILKKSNNYSFFFNLLTQANLNKLVFGSGQPLITGGQLKQLSVTVPSFDEQTKIANFLTAIDDKINNAQAQLAAVKQYKQGLLQQMFV